MKIYCQVCEELIATAEKSDLLAPLAGGMFKSPDPGRMPESLLQQTGWEFIKCPMCKFRPFLKDDEVLTDKGIYKINPPLREIMFKCEICGKETKGKLGHTAHVRSCERKHNG